MLTAEASLVTEVFLSNWLYMSTDRNVFAVFKLLNEFCYEFGHVGMENCIGHYYVHWGCQQYEIKQISSPDYILTTDVLFDSFTAASEWWGNSY